MHHFYTFNSSLLSFVDRSSTHLPQVCGPHVATHQRARALAWHCLRAALPTPPHPHHHPPTHTPTHTTTTTVTATTHTHPSGR